MSTNELSIDYQTISISYPVIFATRCLSTARHCLYNRNNLLNAKGKRSIYVMSFIIKEADLGRTQFTRNIVCWGIIIHKISGKKTDLLRRSSWGCSRLPFNRCIFSFIVMKMLRLEKVCKNNLHSPRNIFHIPIVLTSKDVWLRHVQLDLTCFHLELQPFPIMKIYKTKKNNWTFFFVQTLYNHCMMQFAQIHL